MDKNYAKNISVLREQKGMTRDELARELDVYSILVSGWESGEKEPTEEEYQKLASVLKTSVDELKNCNMTMQNGSVVSTKKSRFTESTMSWIFVGLVWLTASILFSILFAVCGISNAWVTFVYAIPVSCLVLAIQYAVLHEKLSSPRFASILSLMVWTLAVALFLNFMTTPLMWIVFLFPIPLQAIIIALAKLK